MSGWALQPCLMLSLSKHEASGAAAGPALSFDRLRTRACFDDFSLQSGVSKSQTTRSAITGVMKLFMRWWTSETW